MTADPLDYLLGLGQFGIKFGLDNITALVAALGHPERAFRSVHIAGTNGKGSVTAIVDAALRAAGHRSARYTSPHLVSLAERFVIDGRIIDDTSLRAAVATVGAAAETLQTAGTLEVHPTFFEVTTASAFELFRREKVEIAVCEVGMGGRLDATNVLSPMVTAVTSIGADHQQYLGDTLEQIAAEKAGILKPGVPVVLGEIASAPRRVIEQVALSEGCPIIRARAGVTIEDLHWTSDGRATFALGTPTRHYESLTLALAGEHQVENAIVAVRVLEAIDARGVDVSAAAIVTGLTSVQWPGRLQRVQFADGREALLDAAHNLDGAVALAGFLARHAEPRPLVFAAMRDKDARGILATLAPHVSSIIVTRATHHRSNEPEALAALVGDIAPGLPVAVAPAPHDALALAWQKSQRIVVAGSIFLLGDVMKDLGR